jgi:hypothetical protein
MKTIHRFEKAHNGVRNIRSGAKVSLYDTLIDVHWIN